MKIKPRRLRTTKSPKICKTDYIASKGVPYNALTPGKFLPKHPVCMLAKINVRWDFGDYKIVVCSLELKVCKQK